VAKSGRAVCLLLATTASAYLVDALVHTPPNYDTLLPPAIGATYVDPVFGTTIQRLSDALHTLDASNVGYLTWIEDEYSTASPFNSDDSRFLLVFQSYYGLFDGSGNYITNLPFEVNSGSEARWSRTNPNILYYHTGNQLKQVNITTMALTVVHTFSEYTAISGKGQMDISLDGDHLVLLGDSQYMFTYQISTDTKSPVFDTGLVSYSVLYMGANNQVTISWAQSGTTRYTGVELFDVNMNFLRQLTHAAGHMHMGVDTNGEPILIWNNSADPLPVCGQNAVVKVRLEDGLQTCLLSLDFSLAMHISAADNTWAYVETYVPTDVNPASSAWVAYTNEVLQIKLDGSQVRRLAHHRSRPFDSYVYEPKTTASRDGSKIIYSSNFDLQSIQGNPTLYADAYLISTGVTVPLGIQNAAANVTLPSIAVAATAGQTLMASTGVWSGPATAYAYQWQRCNASGVSCVSIAGATSLQYVLTPADMGATLNVVVNASNLLGSAQATSPAIAADLVTTVPAGQSITVDSTVDTSPQAFLWTAGSAHTIATTSPQSGSSGTQYVFASWSDSGALSHSVTAPSVTTTYTANFTTQYQLTTASSPPSGGSVTPTPACGTGCYYNSGATVSLTATASTGFNFVNWTGNFGAANTSNPLSLVMTLPLTATANFMSTTAVLSIVKAHTGNFNQSQPGIYTATVSNAAWGAPTSGTVTVTENVPTGLTLASMAGTGWSCSSNTCTRTDALNGGSSYPVITVMVNVAANAPASLTNSVTVSGGGSVSATATNVTVIQPLSTLALAPIAVNFGSQAVGGSSAAQTVTVTNTGTNTLYVTNVAASGDFSQTNTCTTVAAAGSCTIAATFTPTVAGSRTGVVTVTDNTSSSPQLLRLFGTGISGAAGAKVSLSSLGLNYSAQALSTTSAAKNVVLTNSGGTALTVTSITASGNFAQTNNCGTSVAIAGSCTLNVTFTPTAAGNRLGAITIVDSAAGGPQAIRLSGLGISGTPPAIGPAIGLSNTSLNFGSQVTGTASAAQTVTVTNSGTAALTITTVTPSGDFSSSGCVTSLAPAATCTLTITFTPTAKGLRRGTVALSDNASGSPQVIRLFGNGM
jgi:hypothetical protein